ncbi:MAG: hypothetical protein CMJ67_07765 [Planctomycetaceae bacterium]|nr:hypothetical protein [Planctomycetaceae bacterium]
MNLSCPGRLVTLFLILLGGLLTPPSAAQATSDGDLKKPASWTEFTEYLTDGGDLGWWETSGVTTNVWKTLPAGIKYRYRARISLEESGRQVVRTFTYVDDKGKLISSGSETIVWDDKSKNAIWSVSGFDEDRPWSDSGRLVGFDPTRMVVASKEEAAGETYELRTTIERTGENTRRRTVARADGKGTPFVQEFTRVNHLSEALSGWDPTGTWHMEMNGEIRVRRVKWSADHRCLLITEGIQNLSAVQYEDRDDESFIDVTGNGIMWFDLVTRTIREKYVASNGLVVDGEVIDISSDRTRTRYTGIDAEGVAIHAIVTRTRKDEVMTIQFSQMTYDGRDSMPTWAREPMVMTRQEGHDGTPRKR